ncbi:2,3-dihydroxybenzoate-AMP ligase [Tistrella bauzanensis]|uniref:2,3-dihydroxybenzoate-AMP ligase n=1 Tax=Tistrella bauzanensis TaxID=657419 RepID=A0ABQ1IS81_9PROT|nr:AMP-binding protein [Tistrella bauzanensis]GGB49954.1 2,3-dihydroxybenzoate-AMP ligase [Tistrella bauzanensis]
MPIVRTPIAGVVYPSGDDVARHEALGIFDDVTMPEAYERIAERHAARPALTDPDGTWTHGEVDDLATRLGAALLGIGLQPLDRAIFQMSNSRELVLCLFACLKAGVIPVCTLTAHRAHEIGYLARHSGARAHVICTDDPKFDFARFADEMRQAVPGLEHVIVARGETEDRPGFHALQTLVAGIDAAAARSRIAGVERDPAQVAVFQLSGGTSGIPKIIPRFHNEYLWQIRAAGAFHRLSHETVSFSAAPMMHNAPIVCYWGSTFWEGGEVVCLPTPTPEAMAALIRSRRPTLMAVPPPLMYRLMAQQLLSMDDLRRAVQIAAGFARPLAEKTGASAVTLYGMTEGIICYSTIGDPLDILSDTVGRPIDPHTDIRIQDPETGEPLADGVIGEMVFRGPSSTRGYYDAEERNRDAFTADGYVRSGDLMSIRRIDGVLHLTFDGRVKDVVSRGGEKINCSEVERVLLDHPAIGAVLCVPMPDPVYGERMCAVVIAAPGVPVPDVRQLGAYLEARGMAKFKWPERIEVVADFPLTGSGKPSKPLLVERIAAILRAERALGAVSA